jgi:predicted MPP superfamily phosphohydrolase
MKNLFSVLFATVLFGACHFTVEPEAQNYTIPSWTLYQRALTSGKTIQEAKALLVSKNHPYNINITVHGDPSVQMGVAWFTNANITGGIVQVVEGSVDQLSAFSRARKIPAVCVAVDTLNYVSFGNPDRNKNNGLMIATGFAAGEKRSYTSNKALITGLKPNTVYSYRVGKKRAWSNIGSFTTAATGNEAFDFIYVTDTQANTDENFDVSKKTIETARTTVPNARFLLVTGDLIDSGGMDSSEWEWEQWFEKMKNIWLHLPIVPVQGNHDRSPFSNWFHHFNTDNSYNVQQTDQNAKTAMGGTVYSFVYGSALFMIINFEDYVKGEPYLSALEQWMRDQVAGRPDVTWRIVASHRSVFTGHAVRQASQTEIMIRDKFAPLFQDLKIDLAIQGHDHLYQVIGVLAADGMNYRHLADAVVNQTTVAPTPADGKTFSADVTGKRGGTFDVSDGMIYFMNNSAGKKKYNPFSREQMDAGFSQHGIKDYFDFFNKFGQTGEPTFSKITVSADAIDVATYTVSDTGKTSLFDEFKIVKKNECSRKKE